MYEHLVRSQEIGPLEWLVVNMLMPSLLVTFALQWRAGDRGIGVKPPSREGVVSVTMLPIVERHRRM
jgi:hypothetical protein